MEYNQRENRFIVVSSSENVNSAIQKLENTAEKIPPIQYNRFAVNMTSLIAQKVRCSDNATSTILI